MTAYNRAIEYYSAIASSSSDEKHLDFVRKLQRLFADERAQKALAGDTATAATGGADQKTKDNGQKTQEVSQRALGDGSKQDNPFEEVKTEEKGTEKQGEEVP